ncbi:NAD-dependent epimerase/dehydratase family protein [bacterium]|nr:MAG: NAD-dependent epimerase/dehydratase family protein [bacterium]
MLGLKSLLVTGGAGYVGAVLVPKLLNCGYHVKVLDLYIYGTDVLNPVKNNPNLKQIKADIRDQAVLEKELRGVDTVIHLACKSNDPSFELNPALGKSINYDAFLPLVTIAKKNGVKRFIYASSSSVYGVKDVPEVTEDLPLDPLTDYSKYKAACEAVLSAEATDDFIVSIIRPSTVCGFSPRMRFDLTVNILTNHAMNKGEITVFGGEQMRPNIHIEDMTDFYVFLLEQQDHKIHKEIFNVGFDNYKVKDIAEMVRRIIGPKIPIRTTPTDDNRSYHVSSKKVLRQLGYAPTRTVEDAIIDLKNAFGQEKLPNPLEDIRYYNIRMMQAINLK